ncbi:hypothetical protein CN395_27905 [Priestia megaterium]|uniref:CYTH domain-containing protein n=1 Tax=Priestia megaterium TaxID=1404 RepID=UPI000BF3FBBF|nr:CYTH domain-containing protein [Priestia megaterium]PEU52184.1 hypothetical protein CN395_27905 [Priestia megaterium]
MIKEKELKLSLSKGDYQSLLNTLQEGKEVVQVNHYFDTTNFDLKNQNMTLRIRYEHELYQLTLKVKTNSQNSVVFSNEFNYDITPDQYNQSLLSSNFVTSLLGEEAKEILSISNIKLGDIGYLGKLENVRISLKGFKETLFQIDKTRYPHDNIEYELEIEDIEDVDIILNYLKENYRIKGLQSQGSKYSRFIKYLNTNVSEK